MSYPKSTESEPNCGLSNVSFYVLLLIVYDLYTLLLKAALTERSWLMEGQKSTNTGWLS